MVTVPSTFCPGVYIMFDAFHLSSPHLLLLGQCFGPRDHGHPGQLEALWLKQKSQEKIGFPSVFGVNKFKNLQMFGCLMFFCKMENWMW